MDWAEDQQNDERLFQNLFSTVLGIAIPRIFSEEQRYVVHEHGVIGRKH